jgi:signal transduction histidine kinase
MEVRMRARVVLALAATLCAWTRAVPVEAQGASTRTVLTIHSGAENFPANPILDAGIRERLLADPDVSIDYLTEYLESDLFPSEEASLAFRDYLRRKYQGRAIDVVLAMTDTSLRFILSHRGELFPDVPVVFFGLAGPDETTRNAGGGITGVRTGVAYAETLKLALMLHPSTQRVFVVAVASDQRTLEAVRAEFSAFSRQVSITYLTEPTVSRLVSTVRTIPQGSVILYVWQSQTDPGFVMYSDAVARLVADAASVPVYGTSDLYIGTGVVGGVMRGTRETGTRLGEMALRILAGTRPQDIPIETARVTPVIDWRQVQRWGIDPSRLPPGSKIEYREPSVWERYRLYVVGVVTALVAQAALIAGLLIQRTRRRKAEQEVRRSQAALHASYDRIRDLGSRLLNAQEEERSRIARELHDDISQQLAVLTIDLKLLGRTAEGHAETAAAEALKRAEDIGASVHDLSHRLHPARLRVLGLVDALNGLKRELSHPGVTITFTHQGVPPTLPPDLTLCLFRIVQEALQNANKHSEARNVSVDLTGASDGIALTIVDDGVGFDVNAAWRRGLGLISVRERVEAIGGTFALRSSPGAGTRLEVRVPVSIFSHNTKTMAVSGR